MTTTNITPINASPNYQTTTTTFTLPPPPPAVTVPLNSFPSNLPPELVLKILARLNSRDFVRACPLVCKQWYHILLPESVWQNLCKRHFQLLVLPKGMRNFQEAYKKWHIRHSNLTKGVFASLTLNQTSLVSAPLISAEGKLFSGHCDHQIRVWDSDTGKLIGVLESGDTTYALAYAKDQLFSSSLSGVIKVWNPNTYKCIATFEADQGKQVVCALAYADDKLVIASEDLSIKVLDLTTGEYTFLEKLKDPIVFLNYADGKLMSGDRSEFKIWDLKKSECTMTIRCTDQSVKHDWALSFVYVDGMVISSHFNRSIKFWDLTTGQCIATVQASGYGSCYLVYGDGILFSCTADKVMVWNPKTKECTATLKKELGEENVRYIYVDGKLIRSAGHYPPKRRNKLMAMDFTASDTVIFEEIAGLFERNDVENAKERFSKMPLSARLKITEHRQYDCLSPEQLAQAIRNYVEKRRKEELHAYVNQ